MGRDVPVVVDVAGPTLSVVALVVAVAAPEEVAVAVGVEVLVEVAGVLVGVMLRRCKMDSS